MSNIHTIYFDILQENSAEIIPGKRYKPYLESLIQACVSNIVFQRPIDAIKLKQLFSYWEVRSIISEFVIEMPKEDLLLRVAAAQILL